MTREMPRDQRHRTRRPENGLTKAAEVILAKRNGRGGVVIAHGFGEVGLRMGADPRDEQQAPEHDECPNLPLVLDRQCLDPPIAADPAVEKLRNLRLMLEERDRRRAVIEKPGEAAIVEVDDLGHLPVDEKVGEAHVAMDEPEAMRLLTEFLEPGADQVDRPGEERHPLGRHAHAIAPGTPMRFVADACIEIPTVALEPWRALPG